MQVWKNNCMTKSRKEIFSARHFRFHLSLFYSPTFQTWFNNNLFYLNCKVKAIIISKIFALESFFKMVQSELGNGLCVKFLLTNVIRQVDEQLKKLKLIATHSSIRNYGRCRILYNIFFLIYRKKKFYLSANEKDDSFKDDSNHWLMAVHLTSCSTNGNHTLIFRQY